MTGLAVRDLVVLYRDDDGRSPRPSTAWTSTWRPARWSRCSDHRGSGKSSLLRAVAGLEPAAAGRITWDGTDLAGVPAHRRASG